MPRIPIIDRANMNADQARADGTEPGGGGPERFFDILKRDLEKWQKVVKHAGMKAGT